MAGAKQNAVVFAVLTSRSKKKHYLLTQVHWRASMDNHRALLKKSLIRAL